MAAPAQHYFRALTRHVKKALDTITLERLDINPDRALWEVHGMYGNYHIRLKEIHTSSGRLYSYYILKEQDVLVGWDNYPDRQVLRQKYGRDVHKHLFESIPHQHGFRKTTLELTEEMTVTIFLEHLHQLT